MRVHDQITMISLMREQWATYVSLKNMSFEKPCFQKHILWEWIYSATSSGETTLQKKHQLGGPSRLRGFPQSTSLRDDYIWVSRFDYKFPLSTLKLWSNVSSLGIQGSVFHDRGAMWKQEEPMHGAKIRENIGVGIEWRVDTLSLAQIPIKLEVAFPINDDEYQDPKYLFFGLLSF